MAWFNPELKVKPRSQLINKLIVACSGKAWVLTFGKPYNDPKSKAKGHCGCPQANIKTITLQAIINIQVMFIKIYWINATSALFQIYYNT